MNDASVTAAAPADIPAAELAVTNVPLTILALAMGGFAIGTTEFAAMSLLPYFAEGLGVNEPMAAHAISAYALGVVVGAPIIAVASARMSRKFLLIVLMAAFGLANCLSAISPGYVSLIGFRFLSGLPHGAYFGVAALMAASLVERRKRARAVSSIMLGLTVAMIFGVALATFIGQNFGWRWGFALPGLLALATMAMIATFAPKDEADPQASPLRELSALKNRQVWLTLATGAVGFGGFFAVYSFTASTLLEVTSVDPWLVPLVIAIFGVGMTLGTIVAGMAADRNLMATPVVFMIASAASLAAFPFAAGQLWSICIVILLIGFFGSLGAVLQTRLMDVASDAQTLAAALNHSAFNAANALGPWLAGIAITMGYGFPSAGFVGSALALAGLCVWLYAWHDARRAGQLPA
ncbi:MFS transporter [Aliihoeflea sp. PC F10.4]